MVWYQDERPDWVGDSAWGRKPGHLTFRELLRVAAWKTGQGLGNLSWNEDDQVHTVTREAMEAIRTYQDNPTKLIGNASSTFWDEWQETASKAIGVQDQSGLLRLKGVGYPMATAILSILDPQVWPVIDKWAIKTVFGLSEDELERRTFDWHCAATYRQFAERLANYCASEWKMEDQRICDLDHRAMRISQSKLPKNEQRPAQPPDWIYITLPSRPKPPRKSRRGS